MKLKQVHSFIVLSEELHYGRAAERLQITQPSLSQQIKQLEDNAGVILFQKRGRNIELTKAGLVFKQHALKIARDIENAEKDLYYYRQQDREVITVGASGSHLVLPIFANFTDAFPDTSLVVREFATKITMRKVTDGQVDIGLIYQNGADHQLASEVLLEDEMVAAVPVSHELASESQLSLDQLENQPLIVLNRDLFLRELLTQELDKAQVVPNIICELNNHYACLEYARAQLGIALVTRSLLMGYLPEGVKLLPIDCEALHQPITMVYREGLKIDEPIQFLLEEFRQTYR